MLRCIVTSPQKTKRYLNIKSASFPALSGKVQILSGHAESFFLLGKGEIILRYADGKAEKLQIPSGECHVRRNSAVVVL